MRKLFFALILCAQCAMGLDVNGRWKGDATIEGRANPVHLNLVQQGNTLKGTGGPTAVDQDLLTNAKIDGNKLTFDVGPPGRTPIHFELTATDYELKGSASTKHSGQIVTGPVFLRKRTN